MDKHLCSIILDERVSMLQIDKKEIAQNFSQAVSSYDQWAEAHRILAGQLIALLPATLNSAFDLGCGTGIVTSHLLTEYPSTRVHLVDIAPGMLDFCRSKFCKFSNLSFELADIDCFAFPFQPDVILSNCVLQWVPNLGETLKHLHGQMKSGSRLIFSELIEGSVSEFLESCRACEIASQSLPYRTYEEIEVLLKKNDFVIDSSEIQDVKICYPNALAALKSFKGIGAVFSGSEGYKPLAVKQLNRICQYLEAHYADEAGSVPVTYRVALFAARKA